jgi:hypothetical protein
MLWVLLNKAEASQTLATLQLEELADDQGDWRHEHSQLRQEAVSLRQRVRELEVRMRSARYVRSLLTPPRTTRAEMSVEMSVDMSAKSLFGVCPESETTATTRITSA